MNEIAPDLESANTDQRITITYYTDPLCSWSWAFEAPWRRLRYEFSDRLVWRYRMGGMIPNWRDFNDPLNTVGSPAQMGPLWLQVRHLSDTPIDERIWVEDPPTSSYPACIAVKAAECQGAGAGEAYLRRLREAVMLQRRNVARREVLVAVANELAADPTAPAGFDAARFARDLDAPTAPDGFRDDLKETRYREIGRFPTLTLHRADGFGVIIVGYRPYPALLEALAGIAPDLEPVRAVTNPAEYARFWGRVTAIEVAVALDFTIDEARRMLDREVAAGPLALAAPALYRQPVARAAPAPPGPRASSATTGGGDATSPASAARG